MGIKQKAEVTGDCNLAVAGLRIDGHGVSVAPVGVAKAGWGKSAQKWVALILFGMLWVSLIRQLSYQWSASEQYAFGWFVPLLSLALLWRRWMTRPEAQPGPTPVWLGAVVIVLAVLLLPVRVVHEINPDWPLCSWLLALSVVGLSLYGAFLAGGWRWMGYYAFPIGFILVAVSWPYSVEHGLTQGLMRVVAGLTVELLGWINIPAFQHGNLIEVSAGMVGIDEACSGIRSFQSTIMATLFFGELYRLPWRRRSGLVVSGIILAFLFNVLRTFILTWQYSSAGESALEKWHDPAGTAILLCCAVCLWGLAGWLRAGGELPDGGSVSGGKRSGAWPVGYLIAVGCWAIFVAGANELWYRVHERVNTGDFHWTMKFPTNFPTYKSIELAPRTLNLIASDYATAGEWTDEAGRDWKSFFFRWNPTTIAAVLRARIHRPDRCLPAAGLRQIADDGIGYISAAGLQIPFRKYTYESQGEIIHVFFSQWEDGDEKQEGMSSSKMGDRFRSVLVGRRTLGQQTLELVVTGPKSMEEAEAALREQLPSLVRRDLTGSTLMTGQ